MRIILSNLPWNINGRFGVRAGSRWPFTTLPEKDGYIHYIPFPFFLAYATSLLKKKYEDVRLIDAIAEGINEEIFIERIQSHNPDLIVIETSTPSFKNDIRIASEIHYKLPNCHIALCGPHASVFPEQILEEYKFINYILIREYEYTILDLVIHLESNLDLEGVAGLAFRENSEIKINKIRPTIDNLDDLPWPERETLPIYKYNDGFCNLPQPNVQMWSSRGCPFQCIFCLWPQTIYGEHIYRKRNPKDVISEMEHLINRFDFKAVYFDDDTFNVDRNHVLGICREMRGRGIDTPWAVMSRADLMDEELLKTMADAGLYAVKYGIESADKAVLSSCKKNIDLNKAMEMIKFTKSLGIKVQLSFCLGLPGETKESIQETKRFIGDAAPDASQFSFVIPFPGTAYFKYLKSQGYSLSENWPDYDGNYKHMSSIIRLNIRGLEEGKKCCLS